MTSFPGIKSQLRASSKSLKACYTYRRSSLTLGKEREREKKKGRKRSASVVVKMSRCRTERATAPVYLPPSSSTAIIIPLVKASGGKVSTWRGQERYTPVRSSRALCARRKSQRSPAISRMHSPPRCRRPPCAQTFVYFATSPAVTFLAVTRGDTRAPVCAR